MITNPQGPQGSNTAGATPANLMTSPAAPSDAQGVDQAPAQADAQPSGDDAPSDAPAAPGAVANVVRPIPSATDDTEFVLPVSGGRAVMRPLRGRDMRLAARAVPDDADEMTGTFAMIAFVTTIDGKRIVWEDVDAMFARDVNTLIDVFNSKNGSSAPNN